MLVEDNDQVLAYALDANSTQATWVVAPGEGEPITALHASLDGSMLAMQRSSAFLQFVHIRSSKMFVQGPRSKSRLLKFFWSPSAAYDLVMATEHGLELYQQLSQGQGLRYMGSRKHPTSWCIYSHESRIALLATGEGGLWLQSRHTKSQMMQCSGCHPSSWDPVHPSRQAPKQGLVSVSHPRTSRC